MRRIVVALLSLAVWTLPWPPAGAADGSADLEVTIAWARPGSPHVRTGEIARWTVTVTNAGPSTAEQVEVGASGSDQFGRFTTSCGTDGFCQVGDLAPGASRTVGFGADACLIQTEHRRVWWVTGVAYSTTPDPDPSDNRGDLDVRITGPIGPCAP